MGGKFEKSFHDIMPSMYMADKAKFKFLTLHIFSDTTAVLGWRDDGCEAASLRYGQVNLANANVRRAYRIVTGDVLQR